MGDVHVLFVAGAAEHEDPVVFETHRGGAVGGEGDSADGFYGVDADLEGGLWLVGCRVGIGLGCEIPLSRASSVLSL